MKNKVMQKALSWVLSAAMVATMSGAIPAMATSVYAGEATKPAQTFANDTAHDAIAAGNTISYGALPAVGGSTAMGWTVKATTSSSKTQDAGVLNVVSTTNIPTASYSSDWMTTLLGYFSATEQGTIQSTTINTVASHKENAAATVKIGTKTAAVVLQESEVTGQKLYLPSAYEIANGLAFTGKDTWTRDAVTATADGEAVSTTGYAGYATAAPSYSAAAIDTAGKSYLTLFNLDVTDRTKVLFKTKTGTNFTFTMIGTGAQAVTAPSIKSNSVSALTDTFYLNSALTDTKTKVGVFITDKAYTDSTANLLASGDATVDGTDNTKYTFTAGGLDAAGTSYASLANTHIYVYTYKTDVSGTAYASAPVSADNYVTPKAENFKIDSSVTRTYKATAFEDSDFAAFVKPADNTATITGDSAAVTVTKVTKDGKTYDFSTAKPVDAGTYEVYGIVKNEATVTNDKADNAVVHFSSYTDKTNPIDFGAVTVSPAKIETNAITFTLPDVAQYAAQTSLTYTLKTLKLTAGKLESDKEDLYADDVTCTFALKTSTDEAGTGKSIVTKVQFSKLSGKNAANYTLADTNVVKNGPFSVNVVASPIKSVVLKSQPTQMYYKDGDSFNPTGMVVTVTYESGKSKDVEYSANTANFDITPAIASTVLSSTSATTFTVKYFEEEAKKYDVTTLTPTVSASEVPLTNISLPKTLKVNKDGTVVAPVVTYYPSNTTADRTVTWTATSGTPAGAVEFYDASNTKITVTGNSLQANKIPASIKGVTAGTVTLEATVGTKSASCVITVEEINNDIYYTRLDGKAASATYSDRYDTAAAIAEEAFPDGVASKVAVLVTGKNFPDALAANGLAGALQAPLLMTAPNKLSTKTAELIKKWNLDTVYVIGKPDASISSAAIASLKSECNVATTVSIYGDDRYQTANAIYTYGLTHKNDSTDVLNDYIFDANDTIIVTTGKKAADALSISPEAYAYGMPILLVNGDFSASTLQLINGKTYGHAIVLGKTDSVSDSAYNALTSAIGKANVKRISGDSRYDTSVAIASYFASSDSGYSESFSYNYAGFASGKDAHYPDALSAGMLMGSTYATAQETTKKGNADSRKAYVAPILLADTDAGHGTAAIDFVETDMVKTNTTAAKNVTNLVFLGSDKALTADTATAITGKWTNAKSIASIHDANA